MTVLNSEQVNTVIYYKLKSKCQVLDTVPVAVNDFIKK